MVLFVDLNRFFDVISSKGTKGVALFFLHGVLVQWVDLTFELSISGVNFVNADCKYVC